MEYDTRKQSIWPAKQNEEKKFILQWKHQAIFVDEAIAITLPIMFVSERAVQQYTNESIMRKIMGFHTPKQVYYWGLKSS